jgi:hypothetical protein
MHYMTSMELMEVAESKRGYALLLTAGDEQISKALASGIMAVRLPMAKPLGREEAKVVSAEIDRQRIAEELRRELHPVPVDYAGLAYTAEVRYGESLYEPGVLGKVGEALMVGYAMVVMAFHELFESLGLE